MSFDPEEIEDGTGKPEALVWSPSSGDPLADALGYLERRGKVALSSLATEELQDAALIRAADYVSRAYSSRLQGERRVDDQRLPQPRHDQYREERLIPSNEIPREWLEAWYESCELAASGEVFDVVAEDQRSKKREALGRNAIEDEWHEGETTTVKRYPHIDNILTPIIGTPGRYQRA